jgi:hypothetical protein
LNFELVKLGSYDFPPLGGRPFLQRPLANTAFDVPGSERSDINIMGLMTEEFSRQGTDSFIKHCFKNSLLILHFMLFNEDTRAELNIYSVNEKKGKAVPLHAIEALGGRGGIAPTHSRPRH